MRIINLILLLGITLLTSGCIERFYLNGLVDTTPKIVIEGTIIDFQPTQQIRISYSTTDDYYKFNGVTGCTVKVVDDKGDVFPFNENLRDVGHYNGSIPEDKFIIGIKFRLEVNTPDGKTYHSNYEELLPSPPVDSIYYSLEHHETSEQGKYIDGLQFFVDFKGLPSYGNYFRWIVEETYEYHSTWPIQKFIDEEGNLHNGIIDYSTFTCYKTEHLSDIFLLSTDGLTSNVFKKSKLQFVDNHSQRLMNQYSVLLKQQSMSKEAYLFWKNIKSNNQETAGLYSKQPALTKGNISNVVDSTDVALGYFSVSEETSKRLTLRGVSGLRFYDVGFCDPVIPNGAIPERPRPLYFVEVNNPDGSTVEGFTFKECVDCTMHGGTTDKPDFFK